MQTAVKVQDFQKIEQKKSNGGSVQCELAVEKPKLIRKALKPLANQQQKKSTKRYRMKLEGKRGQFHSFYAVNMIRRKTFTIKE